MEATAMEATTTVWLTKPMAPQDAESVAVMRWAIEEDAAREGSLAGECLAAARAAGDRKSTRLNSSHDQISYAVFCLKKKKKTTNNITNPLTLLKKLRHTPTRSFLGTLQTSSA